MATREEIREGIARRIHTIERTLAKVMYEQSPINCAWEDLIEPFRTLYLQQSIDWMSYLDSQGLEIVKYPKQGDDLTGTHIVWSEPLIEEVKDGS